MKYSNFTLKRKKRELLEMQLIRACQIHLIEVKMKNYSSKVFIFSTFLIQSRNWHFKPGFFVVRKSIFNFSNWHLSIGKKNFTLRFVWAFAFTFEILHVQICFKVTNLCAIRSHPSHYTELMLISSCILHLERLLFESLFKIFDCVIPSSLTAMNINWFRK